MKNRSAGLSIQMPTTVLESPKQTVYQLLQSSSCEPWFLRLLQACPEIVAKLNDPSVSCTVWFPKYIPSDLADADPETTSAWIRRHITPFAVSSSVLYTMPNVPTLAGDTGLQGSQLLRARPEYLSSIGPTFSVNFDCHVVQKDRSATNGLIHVIDQPLPEYRCLDAVLAGLPTAQFSFLLAAMEYFQISLSPHRGGTFFAPTNDAFAGHGLTTKATVLPRILAAHFCPHQTLYSNMLRGGENATKPPPLWQPLPREGQVLEGTRKFKLNSSLQGQIVEVAVYRRGGLIEMKTDSGATVISSDHLASDGVLHVVDKLVFS